MLRSQHFMVNADTTWSSIGNAGYMIYWTSAKRIFLIYDLVTNDIYRVMAMYKSHITYYATFNNP